MSGKLRDNETGLDFFGARYLSGAQGRWTSPDPISFQKKMMLDPQRFNLYAYVRNTPLNFIDPKGEAIELTGDDEQRRKQLAALQSAVGKQAGSYMYDNTVTDKNGNTQHFVGIYTNGPSGNGPAFNKINGASATLGSIIGDKHVASLEFVQPGTKVTNAFGRSTVLGSMNYGQSPGLTMPTANGGARIFILDPSVDPGKLPGSMMGSGAPGNTDTGLIEIHELGHAQTIFQGQDDNRALSNSNADDLENAGRKARDPHADQRMFHDPPGTMGQ